MNRTAWKSLIVAAPFLLPSAAAADQIRLKSGTLLEGEILKQTDEEVMIRIRPGMEIGFSMIEVESIQRSSAPAIPVHPKSPEQKNTAPKKILELPAILEAVKGVSEADFTAALEALPARRGEAVPGLIELLAHEDPLVRARAARALQEAPDATAFSALEKAMDDPWPPVQDAAAVALGRIGGLAVGPLSKALGKGTSNPVVLVRALGAPQDPAAVAPILEAIKSGNSAHASALQAEASRALSRIGSKATAQMKKALEEPSFAPVVIATLRARGDEESVRILGNAFENAPAEQKASIVEALAAAADPSASVVLARIAESVDSAFAEASFEALARRSDEAAAEQLVRLADSPRRPDRVRAAAAAWRISKPRKALDILLELAAAGSAENRIKAAEALGETGAPEAVPILVNGLGSEDKAFVAACREALARINAPR